MHHEKLNRVTTRLSSTISYTTGTDQVQDYSGPPPLEKCLRILILSILSTLHILHDPPSFVEVPLATMFLKGQTGKC